MALNRRNFLFYSTIALASATAYSFGNSIKPMLNDASHKTALLYGTRYGATEDTAHWIAKGINSETVDVINIENLDFDESIKKYDQFIIGSGIWIDGADKKLVKFLSEYKDQVQSKIIASFIVCGTTGEDEAGKKRIEEYFARFHKPLDIKPAIQAHFGGRMIIDKLTDKDRKLLDNFYRNILKKEFVSWDRTNPQKAEKFGVALSPLCLRTTSD